MLDDSHSENALTLVCSAGQQAGLLQVSPQQKEG